VITKTNSPECSKLLTAVPAGHVSGTKTKVPR
jgi:hypothetical protein